LSGGEVVTESPDDPIRILDYLLTHRAIGVDGCPDPPVQFRTLQPGHQDLLDPLARLWISMPAFCDMQDEAGAGGLHGLADALVHTRLSSASRPGIVRMSKRSSPETSRKTCGVTSSPPLWMERATLK